MVFFCAWGEREAFEEHEFFSRDFISLDFDLNVAGFECEVAEVEGNIHAVLANFAFQCLVPNRNCECAAKCLLGLGGDRTAVGFDLGFVGCGGVVVERGLEGGGLGEAGFPPHSAVFVRPTFGMRGDRGAFAEVPAFSVHWAEKLSGEDAEFVRGVRL